MISWTSFNNFFTNYLKKVTSIIFNQITTIWWGKNGENRSCISGDGFKFKKKSLNCSSPVKLMMFCFQETAKNAEGG